MKHLYIRSQQTVEAELIRSLERSVINVLAQFLGVCSNAKTCAIGENLLSVSNRISRPQERLIHADALIRPPTL